MGLLGSILGGLSGGSDYTCPKCGDVMEFVDSDVLECTKCFYSIEAEDYSSIDDDYDDNYPTRDEFFDDEDEYERDDEEPYDEVHGELHRD